MSAPDRPSPRPNDLAERLLPWFDNHAPHLPWRLDHDPYRLLVAVIMLQQTQVAVVLPYYRRFLQAFPTLRRLARADVEEVLRLWEGLGYYARARNLHRAAQAIVAQYAGGFPQTREELLRLPGVGAYTAAALLSIAFEQPIAAIDGNVLRILSRVFWLPGGGREGKEKKRAERLAAAAIPRERPGDHNQALMDLGAEVCTPRRPRCPACPFGDICRARARGQSEGVARRRPSTARTSRRAAGVILKRDKLLLAQRPREGIWGGLWELPHVEVEAGAEQTLILGRYLEEAFGLLVRWRSEGGTHTHGVGNRRFSLTVLEGDVTGGRLRCRHHVCARWVPLARLDSYALPAPHRKIVQEALERDRGKTSAGSLD